MTFGGRSIGGGRGISTRRGEGVRGVVGRRDVRVGRGDLVLGLAFGKSIYGSRLVGLGGFWKVYASRLGGVRESVTV